VPSRATDRYTFSTHPAPRPPKGVGGDNGGTRALSLPMGAIYRRPQLGRRVWAAYRRRLGGRAFDIVTRRCVPAARACSTKAKPVGSLMPRAFWRVIAPERRQGAVHRAERVPRHQRGRSRRRADPQLRPRRLSRCCMFPAASACDPTRLPEARDCCECRLIDHWWQIRDRMAERRQCVGSSASRSRRALADRAGARLGRPGSHRARRRRR